MKKLDQYENDIEQNFDQQETIATIDLVNQLQEGAIKHRKKRQSITLRVSNVDLEAIKIKASKLGLAYQTYINMLLHQDATKL